MNTTMIDRAELRARLLAAALAEARGLDEALAKARQVDAWNDGADAGAGAAAIPIVLKPRPWNYLPAPGKGAPATGRRFDWSAEAVDDLKRLWSEGASAPHIAGLIGCSLSAVYNQASTLRLPKREGGRRRAAKAARPSARSSSLEHACRFLRTRDFTIEKLGDGRFRVDRKEMDAPALLNMANRHAAECGRAPFAA